ncbi:hypothetical protein NE237_028120 [Protea cynaroides]|uniref:Uncharacterized protein n=1 Tax=Protea cynaroides TaxID=273540 RepID=A0A9Q0JV07_9MAGN|nr:hypothetical protein NE237_028120 [Protea cynaroides]
MENHEHELSPNPATILKFSPKKQPPLSVFSVYPTPKNRKVPLPQLHQLDQQSLNCGVQTLRACKLGISRYPNFEYNAKALPLLVETMLMSYESNGPIRRGRGERLDSKGKCKLVGVAVVDPIDDVFMNSFPGLLTVCLAN